ncbi:multiheme c-type cytochrome [Thermophagus sp. OGC60D27]|uniref:multiheme c-type cytochrome n=1 Tax=Thermophagus sp. OGC60D27 TaxID=3458415 RepID=UPI0040384056
MKLSSYKKNTRRLGVVIIFLIPAYLGIKLAVSTPDQISFQQKQRADFVGKESCKDCHLGEYNDWVGSHHDMAMDVANDSTVLGNFSDQTLEGQGKTHKMYKKGERFFVYTDGEDGQMQEFEVKYVFGYTPLQQYLVEFDRGRLQTLPITWNTVDSVWYHMADSIYKEENIDHDNWLHWTNQAQNWNGMCAECHSTNLVKGYDHETDSYNTTWSEIDVSCEACHGPGSRHVEWANLPEYSREDFTNYGLEVKTSGIDHVQYVDNCVRCHSRKSSLGDFDHSAASIYDHVIPDLPDEPSWHVDGQIKDEDYVYASFLQSKMYEREVQCNDCHNVHSGERLFDDNELCFQCHRSDIYDTYDHHHHKRAGESGEAVISESGVKFEVGSGTECVNCHMHGQYYMGVDYRNDHSFRIPRPDLSIENGTPNACNQCHANETNEWSERYITEWFGKRRRYHYAEAFADAKEGKPRAAGNLKFIAENDLYPPNIRSLAIQDLGTYFPDSLEPLVDNYLTHMDPSFRLSAMRSIQQQTDKNIERLLTGLTDATKAVRTESVQRLMQAGEDRIPGKYKSAYKKALEEYQEVLFYNADFPTGKLNLANFYYNQNQLNQAEKYYKAALEQDRELVFIKLNLAYLYNRAGQNDRAEKLFREYIEDTPEDADARFSFALLLTEVGKYEESLNTLLEVREMTPERPRVNHNIAMMYDFMKDKKRAEEFLLNEIEVLDNLNSQSELLRFYLDNNYGQKALQFGKEILEDYPEATEVEQVVKQLENSLSD